MTRHRPAVALLAIGLLPVIAGCDADDAQRRSAVSSSASPVRTESTSSPGRQPVQVSGLTAVLEQYRTDEIKGLVSLKTTNGSSSTVEFHDLRLEWPGLTNDEPQVRSTRLVPGVTFDIRVRQGDAVCGDPPDADRAPPDDAATAVGRASIDGGPPVTVAVPIADVNAILPKVYRRSCRVQSLTWAAELRFGDTWTPATGASGKPAVRGMIELRRRHSAEPLAITRISGSVLLRITPESPADPVASLARDDDALTVPILIEQSGNCAAHALIESKKSFIIPIGFTVGDGEPLDYVITFDTPVQRILNQLINESCGVA